MRRLQSDNKHLNGTTANRADFLQHTATTDRDTRKTRFLRVNKARYTERGYEGKSQDLDEILVDQVEPTRDLGSRLMPFSGLLTKSFIIIIVCYHTSRFT
jgi:hypothetical protein